MGREEEEGRTVEKGEERRGGGEPGGKEKEDGWERTVKSRC